VTASTSTTRNETTHAATATRIHARGTRDANSTSSSVMPSTARSSSRLQRARSIVENRMQVTPIATSTTP